MIENKTQLVPGEKAFSKGSFRLRSPLHWDGDRIVHDVILRIILDSSEIDRVRLGILLVECSLDAILKFFHHLSSIDLLEAIILFFAHQGLNALLKARVQEHRAAKIPSRKRPVSLFLSWTTTEG